MTKILTINVTNNQASTQSFFFFQQPSIYTGGAMVYSNSVFRGDLPAYGQTGARLALQVSQQYFAAIQQAVSPPQVGMTSGYATAAQPIALAPASGTANDWTTASFNPLSLSQPRAAAGVQPGAFRITTPAYQPTTQYNAGLAIQANGGVVLSNFVTAWPNSNQDCQPVLKFYVQTGAYGAGTVLNFTSSSIDAALCDFTGGQTVANVTLQANGTWTVQYS